MFNQRKNIHNKNTIYETIKDSDLFFTPIGRAELRYKYDGIDNTVFSDCYFTDKENEEWLIEHKFLKFSEHNLYVNDCILVYTVDNIYIEGIIYDYLDNNKDFYDLKIDGCKFEDRLNIIAFLRDMFKTTVKLPSF